MAITVAVQPGGVARILCDPLASACDSRAFCADHALAVDVGIGEEERVETFAGRFVRGFYQVIVLAAGIRESESVQNNFRLYG